MAGRKTGSTAVRRMKEMRNGSTAFYFKRSKALCRLQKILI
jgi:hypothetical protein